MHLKWLTLTLAGLLACLAVVGPTTADPGDGDDPGAPAGVDVQARGPVHEAFGEPVRTQAVEGVLVSQEPPRRIDEMPPEEKPEGDNVVWIPGYWSWDEEATNYMWVSGFWRAVPPGRSWVPGHWQKLSDGYRWASGYWGEAELAQNQEQEQEYLPPPPESIDNGPSVPAAEPTSSYIPGCWVYQVTRYVWRPGYWVRYRPNWCWTPACYRWTPCGYIYVSGYWDVPLLDRGMLFAPAYITPAVIVPGYVYQPTYCIQPDFLCGALFVRRGFGGGYYFGDYFTAGYRRNYVAWSSFRVGRVGFDVNFGYYRAAYNGHPAWERNLNQLYVARYDNIVARPPRTLIQQRTVINNITVNRTVNNVVNNNINITNIQNSTVLAPVSRVKNVRVTALSSLASTRPGGPPVASPVARNIGVQRVSAARIAEERQSINRFQTIARQRGAAETKLIAQAPRVDTAKPIRAKIELPKGTPPPRVIRQVNAPPTGPKSEIKANIKSDTVVIKPTVTKPKNGGTRPPVTPGTGGTPGTKPPTTPGTKPPTTPGTKPPTTPGTKPPTPGSGGTKPPAVTPGTPGTRPPTPGTGGTKPPAVTPGTPGTKPPTPGSGGTKPPAVTPGTPGTRPPSTPTTPGSGGTRPPAVTPGTGGTRPPTIPGANRPPSTPTTPGSGGTRPPSVTPPAGTPRPPMGTPGTVTPRPPATTPGAGTPRPPSTGTPRPPATPPSAGTPRPTPRPTAGTPRPPSTVTPRPPATATPAPRPSAPAPSVATPRPPKPMPMPTAGTPRPAPPSAVPPRPPSTGTPRPSVPAPLVGTPKPPVPAPGTPGRPTTTNPPGRGNRP